MEAADAIGYLASAFVLLSFLMTSMTRLRAAAILSNGAFIGYGMLAGLTPVLALHVVLLPINIWHLRRIRRLAASVERASSGDFDPEWLQRHATACSFAPGELIVRQGADAEAFHLLVGGSARVESADVDVGPGEMVGEIGMFSARQVHGGNVRCLTDVETLRVSRQTLMDLHHDDPAIAFHLTRLIVSRLSADTER